METVLIANRGEIAVRVVRAAAEAGLRSVAVYADQDADALHVRLADAAVALPGDTAARTYLNVEALLAAARTSGADAVHPGYGFLSENAEFARAVEAAGLVWIGPTPETIEALGDKVTARAIARDAGAPLAPGTTSPLADAAQAEAFADEFGLPIMIKAAHGGGGRGMRVARTREEVADAFESATREAVAAFGRGECFVEKFLERPRHLEVQVLGDGSGAVTVVGDRDCSLQRRNQKLVEEAPAPGLSPDQRETLHRAARDICAAVRYRGAGTVEFLLGADGTLSFCEVNTRLQVEHPVTELVTGVDLVREQFRIAAGRGPSFTTTPEVRGHAFEFRINAEDPGRGFLPSPGRVTALRVPSGPGVRWDGGVEAGDTVAAAFDSLAGKLLVHAGDRDAALARARRALAEFEVTGIATVLPFARAVVDEPDFSTEGFAVGTQWIETELMPRLEPQLRPAPADGPALQRFGVEIDGRMTTIGLPAAFLAALGPVGTVAAEAEDGPDEDALTAATPGTLTAWLVEDGAQVTEGQDVAVVEAMKMESRVPAHRAGTVQRVAQEGAPIGAGEVLARIG
ncbi:acetyl/propionyl/methylcrotonyl-CoA carboxylase subunit alpha [Kineococcus sp. SYSU DK001]|uniref:acetyl/propionyl/methylcrotonyl-CoA carboxylase subunit alpha n=1 Tax=Kineococcus sp. SYSU DK001 TaxID=3383122 RepID=UPI003D7C7566